MTGGSGFIGGNVLSLLSTKYCVIFQHRKNIPNNIVANSHVELDINSYTDWSNCLEGVETVVHLAGVAHNNSTDPSYINEVNVCGAINLASQSVERGVKRFVFISSIGVSGNSPIKEKGFNEDSEIAPNSHNAQSKIDVEMALLEIAKKTELEIVIIRPALVYGVGAPGNFGKLVDLVKKTPILPFSLCKNKLGFVSVDNLTDFISICIEHPKAKNEVFCVSDGVDFSIKELTNGIAKGLGKPLFQIPIPNFIFSLLGKATGKHEQINQLTGDLLVDSSKARELLGWEPPFTMAKTLSRLTENN
ncbi:NAD-dependent epimerase/dehydratase family protein [Vibrio atlanticus]|uniref:NAD-dependent epimerase/dehydratase family protein n=1 Tax=Vibrio atlanticus TaxID=693153 RepID=UPI0009B6DF49|nr:NAD-dependent epimerase/dehydratase family protein [Vibrio atlanticus]